MTNIWVPIVASIIGGVIGAATAFGVFAVGERHRLVAARREAKRVAVSRMLDVLDHAIRVQALPPLVRRLRNADVVLALSLQRLMLDLPKEDLPVAAWAGGQVQRMVEDGSGQPYLHRATYLQGQLVGWYRGDRDTQWFVEALKTEPLRDNWKRSLRSKLRVGTRDGVNDLAYLATASFAVAGVREVVMPLASRLVRWLFRAGTGSEGGKQAVSARRRPRLSKR